MCELHYEKNQLRLISQDNGVGIRDEALASEGKNGHWGLIGTQERTHKIGAVLSIDTGTSGTRIELRVPGYSAFSKSGNGLLRKLFSWFSRSRE